MTQITQEALAALIAKSVETQLAPLNQRMTTWQEKLLGGGIDVNTRVPKGIRFGTILRAMAAGRGDPEKAKAYAAAMFAKATNPIAKANFDYVAKTLVGSTFGAGGAFVPEDLLPEVIEFLRPQSGVRRLDPTILPNPSGNLHVPRINSGATATYRGEATDNKAQTPGTGDIVLTHKILDVIIPISKELLMSASPNVDAVITADATRAVAQAEDTAFIRGTGGVFSPKGIRYLTAAANVTGTAASGPTDFANIKVDVSGAEVLVSNANVNLATAGWLMPSRTFINLRDLRNTNGFLFYPSLSEGKMYGATRDELPHLNGYPVSVTNNIPINLASSTQSELYFAAASEIVIGEMTTMEIEMSTEASYKDASGTLVSAFTRGELLLKLTARHDVNLRHDLAAAIITGTLY